MQEQRKVQAKPLIQILRSVRYTSVQLESLTNNVIPKIILFESQPVITLGKRATESELLLPREALAKLGIEVVSVERGGYATYHGPGQWVLFIQDTLENLTGDRKGVRRFVERLLGVALKVAENWLNAKAGNGAVHVEWGSRTGVWLKDRKWASVGIEIKNGVVFHGLCINGFATENSFIGLKPCGLSNVEPGYLIEQVDAGLRDEQFERLGKALLNAALLEFYPVTSVEIIS